MSTSRIFQEFYEFRPQKFGIVLPSVSLTKLKFENKEIESKIKLLDEWNISYVNKLQNHAIFFLPQLFSTNGNSSKVTTLYILRIGFIKDLIRT